MELDLVNFETAKLAQEKGFDWGCLHGVSNEHPEVLHRTSLS